MSSTSFSMTVKNSPDVQITVEPCFQSQTSRDAQTKDTRIRTDLPPTARVSVKWTEKQAADVVVQEVAKQPLSLLVEHEHLFSVGEGMLLIDSVFRYDIRSAAMCWSISIVFISTLACRNGTISAIDIIVDPRVRVLSVEGANLKRWDVAQGIVDASLGKVDRYCMMSLSMTFLTALYYMTEGASDSSHCIRPRHRRPC